MARYFITGATGFIGGHVARQLREAGQHVVALVRSPDKAVGLRALGVELAPGDVTEPATLRAPMEGADGVFHLAAWYAIGRREPRADAINVQGTRNVLTAMRDAGVPKGVYTSTLAVFGDTHGKLVDETYRHDGPFLSEYDRTKWEAHYDVALPMIQAGLPLVIVQPGLVYGPGDTSSVRDTLVQYLRRRLPMVPAGTAFCWGHVEDTARGHLLAMERGTPGESYIIAGPPHTLADALKVGERITGIPAPRVQAPAAVLKAASVLVKPFERILPLPDTYTSEGLRVVAGTTYIASNAKARRELGLSMRPLEEGLRETLLHEQRLLEGAAAVSV